MFIKRRSNILYRDYKSFGLITDNRNYGYKKNIAQKPYVGDKIVSKSGSVFLSELGRNARSLDDLVGRISTFYPDVPLCSIRADAVEYFSILENEGFVVSGQTINECDEKDGKTTCAITVIETQDKEVSSTSILPKKTTQLFLEEYFNGQPQLSSLHIENHKPMQRKMQALLSTW